MARIYVQKTPEERQWLIDERKRLNLAKVEERDRRRTERALNRPVPGQRLREARDSLPEELQSVFDDLVSDYKFAAEMRLGRAAYHPGILSALIIAGWRRPIL